MVSSKIGDGLLNTLHVGSLGIHRGFFIARNRRGMKDFAAGRYKSKRWQTTRLAYLKSVGGLCERCLKKGLYKPAVIVHHKVYLTAENINNPEITLNWNNLEAVCRECHEDEHRGQDRRYTIREDGTVEIK